MCKAHVFTYYFLPLSVIVEVILYFWAKHAYGSGTQGGQPEHHTHTHTVTIGLTYHKRQGISSLFEKVLATQELFDKCKL